MESLAQMHCVACRKDAPKVTDAQSAELHPQVPEWEIVDRDGINRLRRVFAFDDFGRRWNSRTRSVSLQRKRDITPRCSRNGAGRR